jgi:nitrate reductase NapA
MKGGLAEQPHRPQRAALHGVGGDRVSGTYGVDEPAGCYDDLDSADVVILWGNNPAEMHPVLFSRVIDRARAARRSRSSTSARAHPHHGFADHYLSSSRRRPRDRQRHRPPADRARHLRPDFVEKHCNFRKRRTRAPDLMGEAMTFEEFRAAPREYTPENVEELSGVPAARRSRMLADLFGRP